MKLAALSTRLAVPAAAAIALLGGGVAFAADASAPSGTGYAACVSTAGRTLYHVTTDGTPRCFRRDAVITWDQTGPQGATGATGATGDTGPTGPQGPVGPSDVYYTSDNNGALSVTLRLPAGNYLISGTAGFIADTDDDGDASCDIVLPGGAIGDVGFTTLDAGTAGTIAAQAIGTLAAPGQVTLSCTVVGRTVAAPAPRHLVLSAIATGALHDQ